jgi:HAMP domain-containing protein/predicted Ser/Thr protein kinase
MTIATDSEETAEIPAPAPTGAAATGAAESALAAPGTEKHRVGLGMRLFFTAALLIAATLGLAIGAATWQANRLASEEIRRTLQPVPDIFAGYVAGQGQSRRAVVRALADEVGTKALLGGGADPATFTDSAVEFAGALGASVVFLFDDHGELLARSDRRLGEEAGRDFSAVSWVRGPLESSETVSSFILEVKRSRRLLLVAAAPVAQGAGAEERLVGLVAAAFPLDDAAARQLGQLVSGEVAVLANVAPRTAALELSALATTPALRDPALAAGLAAVPDLVTKVLRLGQGFGPFEFKSGETVFLGTAVPVASGSGEPIAALVVGRSKEAQLASFRRLRSVVLELGGAILLLALPVSFGLARRISRPIEQLARGADAVRHGQLDIVLPRARQDELGTLARAFGAMVAELREKRELEQLLATLRAGHATPTGPLSLSSSPEGPQVGEVLAHRYEVLKLLGQGGMGRVFQARDRELEEIVALKVLSPKLFTDRERYEHFLRQEIRLARLVTHPNVVRVHDLGEVDGLRFVSMEYVAGTSLRQLVRQSGRLELAPGLQIAKQICRGLQAVHAVGIVHGDLKPDNIIVMPNGVVKLMDFGVARPRQAAGAMETLGTPHFMSPEHARGAMLDERSDLYSLGVVMFVMFTGRVPFEGTDWREVLRLHLYAPAPSARELRPDLPELLVDVIARCMGKSRPERPATAAELERALMRVRD